VAPLPRGLASEAGLRQGGAVGAVRERLEKGDKARSASQNRSTHRGRSNRRPRSGAKTRTSTCARSTGRELPVMPWVVGKSPPEGQTMFIVTCAWAARARPSKFSFAERALGAHALGAFRALGDRPGPTFRGDSRTPTANDRLYRVASAFGKFSEAVAWGRLPGKPSSGMVRHR